MNVIVLGKIDEDKIYIIEHQDRGGQWWAVKYGDWNGDGVVDWYTYDGGSTRFERHNFSDPGLFRLVNYPLVPARYNNQYVLVCLANEYELFAGERLHRARPVDVNMISRTIRDMWDL